MSAGTAELPGFWRLAWMLFMQPISLHYRLKACGIDEPNAPAWKLWRTAGPEQTIRRAYVRRMFAILLILTPVGAIALAGLLRFLGFSAELAMFGGVVLGVPFSVALSVLFSVALDVPFGVALSVALSMALSVVFSVVFNAN